MNYKYPLNAALLVASAAIPVFALQVSGDSENKVMTIPIAIENDQPSFGWKPTPFVNFESPHVSPIDITPDGSRVLVVNTPDNRLEILDTTKSGLAQAGSISVGLDPVSVRVRSNSEAWVVNHISDSISIVDLNSMRVTNTIYIGDEPADVIFAGSPQRAYITVSQENSISIIDPNNLDADPIKFEIEGEDPRALATDGEHVYAAIYESGNRTTIVSELAVSFPSYNPYPDSPNPPPNSGDQFDPPILFDLPEPPPTGIIVRMNENGQWMDDNGYDWSTAVTWDLHDHDLAIIDTSTHAITYGTDSMNINMALAPHPSGGVTIVGTDATNEVRFEPNLNGIFVRVHGSYFDGPGEPDGLVDLNPHLDYKTSSIPMEERKLSIGDPRAIIWESDGGRAFIAGMGSNNVVVTDQDLVPYARIDVNEGPTGLRLDESNGVLYVLSRFDSSVSIIDTSTLEVLQSVGFYDPTPTPVRKGRKFLYDTHLTSGLGQASCASCHTDSRMDQIAWELGDPSGQMKEFNQDCVNEVGPDCVDWHPMKGPMTTQTLAGAIGFTDPLHWRGDKEDLSMFNPTFTNLQGADSQISDDEMGSLETYLQSIVPPPNPFRNLDNSLQTSFVNGGNPVQGLELFNTGLLDDPFNCVDCHAGPFGTENRVTPGVLDQQIQDMNSPHLFNLYEKTGYEEFGQSNNRGYGFVHDGSFDTLFKFLDLGFEFTNDQQKLDMVSFLHSFSQITHAGVGAQVSVDGSSIDDLNSVNDLISIASTGSVGLVVNATINGEQRGYYLSELDTLQSDRAAETITPANLIVQADLGSEQTWTLVPIGSGTRIGIDRDEDGHFDRDELDAGTDPANPGSCPTCCIADLNNDGELNFFDISMFLNLFSAQDSSVDFNQDGFINFFDVSTFLNAFNEGCP